MFEVISEIISGAPTLSLAEPLLKEAGFKTRYETESLLRVTVEKRTWSVTQLWGNRLALRGVDSEGVLNEALIMRLK